MNKISHHLLFLSMEVDYIIVGQGLAGTLLAFELLKLQQSFIIYFILQLRIQISLRSYKTLPGIKPPEGYACSRPRQRFYPDGGSEINSHLFSSDTKYFIHFHLFMYVNSLTLIGLSFRSLQLFLP